MNYRNLSLDETAFMLFAFKRCLRDRNGLTPVMIQFYERSIEVLKEKMLSLEKDAREQRSYGDRARNRRSQVSTTWPNY